MKLVLSVISGVLLSCANATYAAPLNTLLDFNDNKVPVGWTLQDTSASGHHVGVSGGRFYAAQVDSSANLYTAYTAAGNGPVLNIQWDGSVFQTYYGNSLVLTLLDTKGNEFSVGIWAKQVFNGNGIRFYIQDNSTNYHQQLNVPDGTYSFSAVFADASITFNSSLNSSPAFSMTKVIPNLVVKDINRIQFYTSETTGPDSWFDNIKIVETVSSVPEPSAAGLLLAGLGATLILRSRNRAKNGA